MVRVRKKIKSFCDMPLSRKLQSLSFLFNGLYTNLFYRFRLKSCGSKVTIFKPLFWTPEYLSVGHNVLIWHGSRIEGINQYGNTSFLPLISLGNNVSLQQNCHIISAGDLKIGHDVTISLNVMINDTDHGYKIFDTNVLEQQLNYSPITIGSSCFIGAGARILSGTILGDHCIVGANAVVKGHFPSGCVIAGIPARIIKKYDPVTQTWLTVEKNKE
ncbi:transferase family hexapeptide repeat protein|uniref:Transferase family hexapeptide repeat protein n=1 Tax=Brenneria salicis ATCC 15712 = DSM 30166 TaxID=714314 RepID=A0A366I3X3_9GAMM|nr:acyltransferase [Brenneria salicis]NMN92138.1 transferase family hexapeptide repeat protein [Brenneria salicis ATCC 15712 = DSM 30166]RBP61128.1 transferase family hexapeptide repeat protein [Brenneria salicis ATCC 15712 = DSM 30166]